MPLALRVPPECDGWRLDHFLKQRIRRLSRTKIRTIIETQVWLSNGRQPRPAMAVRTGDTIHIDRPAPIEPEVPRDFPILASDAYFMAIDKPAGLPMHTTAKFWKNTLVAILRERYPEEGLQICHRIDRETSGVLLIARTREAASFLKRAFASRAVKKTYLALVHGIPAPSSGVIDAPMRLIESRSHLMMGVEPDGLPAVTRYRVHTDVRQARLGRGFARNRPAAPDPRAPGAPRPSHRGRQTLRGRRAGLHGLLRFGDDARAARPFRWSAPPRPARGPADLSPSRDARR
jgi:RluA family pseudouridine synthase